ncbi:MAG: SulP family inorganic anion transporter [Oscillospiraceae bacterium]|nr:SulP family inorganic anion transporter [Oscillospiraceae bacterium]
MFSSYLSALKKEFAGYNGARFSKDLMAGLTVTAVALPLALAFGVSSGADAAAGLITAILSGVIMSLLSGASYQISGPTGAMTAVLITIVSRCGMQGVFLASLMAGILLLLCGIFRFGKLVGYIPAPVITGFTSGIAIIIALGQIDNFFGTHSEGETAIQKLASYGKLGFSPNWQAVVTGLLVVVIMIVWPKKWNARVPSSLIAIIVAGLVSNLCGFDIASVGQIPRTLLPQMRLSLSSLDPATITGLIPSAFTIAALGMIESLLCGASASRMKNEKFNADQELIAQGVGNMVIPFFGGVPSTAAIARTSVAIKSGCQTRLTGVIHSVGLLICMFLLGGIMAKLPLAALAGVLMVTAWRMNEWHSIRYIFSRKMRGAMAKFLITMAATVIFDLTVAILIGVAFSILLFVVRASNITVTLSEVDNSRIAGEHDDLTELHKDTVVAYIAGPIFFGTAENLTSGLEPTLSCGEVILSMRGVSTMDTTGVQALLEYCRTCEERGILLILCGVSDRVKEVMLQAGIGEIVPEERFFFSVDRALLAQP